MALYSYSGIPLKIFVKEQNIVVNDVEPSQKAYLPVVPLTGDSAKKFYQSVISEAPTPKPEKTAKEQKSPNRSAARSGVIGVDGMNFKHSNLHKLAQYNEFETLERLLRGNKNVSVDAVDSFGWTPLMCATYNQAKEAVEVLLRYKANPNIYDKFGNSALSLAKKKNFDIKSLIKKWDTRKQLNKKRQKSIEPVFCNICKSEFHTDIRTHESSTLHLFNSRSKNPKTFYGIPDSNKGFQLLLKSGWNREKGLGSKECGMKFPIKVTKNVGRTGIGGVPISSSKKNENTHIPGRNQVKKIILSQEKRDKIFERNYRLQFI